MVEIPSIGAGRFRVSVMNNDESSACRKHPRIRGAQAAAGAGDDDNLAFEANLWAGVNLHLALNRMRCRFGNGGGEITGLSASPRAPLQGRLSHASEAVAVLSGSCAYSRRGRLPFLAFFGPDRQG